MNRRSFLASAAALALLPTAGRAVQATYEPGLLNKVLDSGSPVVLDFFAPWCGTCQAQKRVIAQLFAENPVYMEMITYLLVDWDTYKRAPITQELQIPRRSTLVAIGPDKREVARVVAQTGKAEIKALFDAALATA